MHWVGWGSIALLAFACFANGYLRGAEFLLAFAGAAAVGLLIRKRALTTMGGAGALALTVGIAFSAEPGVTWAMLVAGAGAMGLMFMPWRMRNPWA